MSLRHALATVVLALACAAPAGASSNHCTPPHDTAVVWQSLHESGLGCHSARELGLAVRKHGRITGWSCSHRVSGRYVSFSCFHQTNHHQTLAGSWNVP
jgi:hypothetical protein